MDGRSPGNVNVKRVDGEVERGRESSRFQSRVFNGIFSPEDWLDRHSRGWGVVG